MPFAVDAKLETAPEIVLFPKILIVLLPSQIVCHSAVFAFQSILPVESVILVTDPSGIVIVFTWLKSIAIFNYPKTTDFVTVVPSDKVNVQVSLVWLEIAVETSEVVA